MSVRRLAEDAVQPQGFAFSSENAGWVDATIRKYPEGRQQSAVIPLLMRAQEQEGWVTKAAIEHVAQTLAMPMIRVLEVATFYTQFQLKPVGSRAHVQVCGTTPCMLRGSDDLKAVCRAKIHPEPFHLSEDGTLSWEEVECLGACVNAPMVMIARDTYEDLTGERLGEIIDAFAEGKGDEVRKGPQIDRHLSVPIGGLTTLTGFDGEEGSSTPPGRAASAPSASPQSAAGGSEATTPPSQAGRPNTSAPETDPTIEGPGKAANGNVHPAQETAASTDPAEGGHRPGAGSTGGTQQGPTGAGESESEKSADHPSDDASRPEGPLKAKGEAAEDAVVLDEARVGHDRDEAGEGSRDLSGKDQTASGVLEGQRSDTDDVLPGPVSDDDFDPAARQSPSAGERPAGLLAAPEGPKDDLKAINGVGPVIETKLNELGVFHFRQIAGWSAAELDWIDDQLNFRGRAVRDRWVEQAKALQSGSGPAGQA